MTTATNRVPGRPRLAADLNRWDAELPKLVTARLAAAKAVDAPAREALAQRKTRRGRRLTQMRPTQP